MAAPTLAQFIASQATGYETVREYIGARYVPVFANPIEWSDTRGYEPLTIVLHQGNSYTSMQAVPTGIDIENTAFWALTGNYNAQVEAYRAEVQQYQQTVQGFDARITQNADDIATNMADIASNKTAITATTATANAANATATAANATATAAKKVTDKLKFSNTIAGYVLFQTSSNDTEQVSLVFYPVEGTTDVRSNLTAFKSGLSFYINGQEIWMFDNSLRKISARSSNVDDCGFNSAMSGSGAYGVGLFSTHGTGSEASTAAVEMTDRSYIYRQDGTIQANFNPITRITYPLTDLQVALRNNIAIISCNGNTVNLANPTEWQTIATASQLGITASSGESVYGTANIDYEGGSVATLRFNSAGLAIRASGVSAGSHNVYGQVVAAVNVTFTSTQALANEPMTLDDDGQPVPVPDAVPENSELMTFLLDE